MIPRYTRSEMGALWSAEHRFRCLLDVEIAVAEAQSALKLIPARAAKEIRRKGKFSVTRIAEIEKTTKHDVIAFVTNVAENVGPMGRLLHYGLTSSDVLDTATSLQVRGAGEVLLGSLDKLLTSLGRKIEKSQFTLCAGRTHGMHAEATTFGFKLAGHLAEFRRGKDRLRRALDQFRIVKLSGAVGTFSTQPIEVEKSVGRALGLEPETLATQVIPRDRHAEVLWSLAMLGAAVERLSVELRHLQRTEVGEVIENFTPGQKGSSAMPHKKNPISAENLSGLARLLRANAAAAIENIALWHERDISHSSVERVILPDSFILADYALDRLSTLVDGLFVDAERMKQNMALSKGQLFSSQVLLVLVDKGLPREEAYRIVQRVCHDLEAGDDLEHRLLADPEAASYLSASTLRKIFSGERQNRQIAKVLKTITGERHARKRKGQGRIALRR